MEYIATYTVKEASQLIGISVSTVRKYSLLLESLEYKISRTQQNARIFYDADILALRRLNEGTTAGRTLDAVAREIATAAAETHIIKGSPPAPNDAEAIRQLTETIEVLSNKIDAMTAEQEETRRSFKMALHKIEDMQQRIIEVESDEVEKETAATTETESKRGIFGRLFGKNK